MAGSPSVDDLVSMGKKTRVLLLAALVLCVLAPMRYAPDTPIAHASSVIAGYAYSQSLLVTNPATTTVNGSVVAGTVAATSTDYVVQLHLQGANAASVYANARDKTKFTDVTVWWWSGTSYQQIDTDYDPYTNGGWGANNVTLWFKLQAPIAGGASDPNYVLAWDDASPTAKHDWTHIYSFSDDFNSSAGQGTDESGRIGWNSTEWGSEPSWVSISGGFLSITSTANSGSRILGASAPYRLNLGYALTVRSIFSSLPAAQTRSIYFFGSGPYSSLSSNNRATLVSDVYAGSESVVYSSTVSAALDTYSLAIAGDGTSYAWKENGAAFRNTLPMTAPLSVGIDPYNGSATDYTTIYDYVKVRPFQPQEPTVTVVGSPLTGLPAAANLFSLAVTGAALSLAVPTTITAPAVTLNGSAQTTSALLSPLGVTDARGTGAGWSLTLAMADPKSGSHTIPFTGMSLTPGSPSIVDSSGTSPVSLTVGSPGSLSGFDGTPGTTASTAYPVLTAAAMTGRGGYTQPVSLSLTIPATASVGTYTANIVVTVQ
jgi:hypothetical protein